jgi:hypothetical protein
MPFEQLLFDFATTMVREKPRPRGVRARPGRPGRPVHPGLLPSASPGISFGISPGVSSDVVPSVPPVPAAVRVRPRSVDAASAMPCAPSVLRLVAERIDGKKVMPQPPRGIDHDRPVQRRYDAIVEAFLTAHGLRVRCWRRSLSGLATLRIFRDGHQERTIESPYPTSPLRLAIFLHEVGHHVIGLGVFRPRCLEEFHAWRYAIDRMAELGVPTDGTVQRRFERSMRYAVSKSTRRGIRRLPAELAPFVA